MKVTIRKELKSGKITVIQIKDKHFVNVLTDEQLASIPKNAMIFSEQQFIDYYKLRELLV